MLNTREIYYDNPRIRMSDVSDPCLRRSLMPAGCHAGYYSVIAPPPSPLYLRECVSLGSCETQIDLFVLLRLLLDTLL